MMVTLVNRPNSTTLLKIPIALLKRNPHFDYMNSIAGKKGGRAAAKHGGRTGKQFGGGLGSTARRDMRSGYYPR